MFQLIKLGFDAAGLAFTGAMNVGTRVSQSRKMICARCELFTPDGELVGNYWCCRPCLARLLRRERTRRAIKRLVIFCCIFALLFWSIASSDGY